MVRVVRTKPDAELVRQTTALMGNAENISINMPSAPMPLPGGDAPALTHPCLVTSLTGNQPYYLKGGLIPHLTKKGWFWKSTPPAIHLTVLKYRLHIDPVTSAYLDQIGKIDCGWTAPLPRVHHYGGATGLHLSLGPDCALKDVQYWIKQDGTTAKAASPALPPVPWSNSVQGLTHHFEQMTMRSAVPPMDMGHLPDEATAEVSQISLNHDEISMEYCSGHIFPAYELAPTDDRHHEITNPSYWSSVQLDPEPRDCLLGCTHWQATEEATFLTILLEEVRDRDKVRLRIGCE